MFVSVMVVRSIAAELRRLGHGVGTLLPASVAREGFLDDMRNMVSIAEFEEIVERAIEISGDPGLGLSVGLNAPEGAFQLFAILARSASTLAGAFDTFERYSSLLADGMNIAMHTVGQSSEFRFRFHPGVSARSARFGAESLAAAVHRFTLQIAPQLRLRRVEFAHPQPEYTERYRAVFGCPVVFGAAFNGGRFDSADLESPSEFRDLAVDHVVRDAANQLLTAGSRVSFVDRVRAAVRAQPNLALVDLERLARQLGTGGRALRRRLAAADTSLSELVREARLLRARDELLQPGASIKEVAERLGYSEPSAFHRAFKRMTGRTPGEYSKGRPS